jgi:hypothetical protein
MDTNSEPGSTVDLSGTRSLTMLANWAGRRAARHAGLRVDARHGVSTLPLMWVRALDAIKAEIRGYPVGAPARVAACKELSRPIVDALHGCLHEQVKWDVGRIRSGQSDSLCHSALTGVGDFPRRWPGGDGHQRGGACDWPEYPDKKHRFVRRVRWRTRHQALAKTLIQTATLNCVNLMAWLTTCSRASSPAKPRHTRCMCGHPGPGSS